MKKIFPIITTILIVGLLLLITAVVLLIAASGLIQIPLLSHLLGTDKPRDLGVEYDPTLFDSLLKEKNITLTAHKTRYCLECRIIYSEPAPLDVSLNSAQLTSYLRSTNDELGVFKQLQVKLGDGNMLEASAMVDLRRYGYSWNGPLYARGWLYGRGNRVNLVLDRGEAGILPVPKDYAEKGVEELENAINNHLAWMPGLTIEELSIEDGVLHYKGNFPRKIEA